MSNPNTRQELKLTQRAGKARKRRQEGGGTWGSGKVDHKLLSDREYSDGGIREAPEINSLLTVSESDIEETKPEPFALLAKLYPVDALGFARKSRNSRKAGMAVLSADLESLAERAQNAGFEDLENRCLEDLATRRARGTWIATSRRPLPDGAYSNLRNA